jgi:hypothetical protein
MKTFLSVLVALTAIGTVQAAKPSLPEAPDGRVAFDKLKTLAGTWHGYADKPDNPGTVEYRMVAGGSVLMETLLPGTPHEMISMYFLEGGNLLMTHYCAVGNQPQMVYDRKHSKPDEFVFKFDGGRGFIAREDLHVHNGAIKFIDDKHLETTWTSWNHGKEEGAHRFVLTHQPK